MSTSQVKLRTNEFGLSISGDHFFSYNTSFYDPELNDLSVFKSVNRNQDPFLSSSSGSSQHSSFDESFMLDSSGSPMIEDSLLDVPEAAVKVETRLTSPVETEKNRPAKRKRMGSEKDEICMSVDKESKIPRASGNLALPSREEILEMSSKEFESRIEQIERTHVFTNRELQEIKVSKRLIKNRESAQASRQKKKQIVRELEQRVIELEEENFKLRRNTTITSAENIALKNELRMLYLKYQIRDCSKHTMTSL